MTLTTDQTKSLVDEFINFVIERRAVLQEVA